MNKLCTRCRVRDACPQRWHEKGGEFWWCLLCYDLVQGYREHMMNEFELNSDGLRHQDAVAEADEWRHAAAQRRARYEIAQPPDLVDAMRHAFEFIAGRPPDPDEHDLTGFRLPRGFGA